MRIALVTNNYTPYSGGVVSSINAYARQLMASGHTIVIITLDFLGDQHQDEPFVKRVASITSFIYKNNPMSVPWRPDAAVLSYLEEFKPDIVHVQHPFLLGQSALYAARELSVPVLFTYHTMYEYYSHYVPLYQPLVKAAVTKKVLQFCGLVDHIIAPSAAVHDYLVDHAIATPITVIPSPLQEDFFYADGECAVRPGVASPVALLCVSRLVKEKNIPYLLDLMSHLDAQSYQLTLVGYGEQEEALRTYAYETLKLSPSQVLFVIRPERCELLRLYREADLFLFPSTTDTQGLVLAESMASGTPVLALDGPGQRDIVHNGINGYIVDSMDEMIAIIQRLATHGDELERLRSGACATAQQYHPVLLTTRLLQVYDELLRRTGSV